MTRFRKFVPNSSAFSRSLAWLVVTASVSFGSVGCGEVGSGVIVEKTRSLDSYDHISVEEGFEVSVVMADEYRLRVWADDNLVDSVHVHQDGHEVHLDMDEGWFHDATLRAEFTLPQLAGVELEDGSELSSDDLVFANSLTIDVKDGSSLELSARKGEELENLAIESQDGSEVLLNLEAETTTAVIRDGSEVTLKGKGSLLDAEVRDGATLNAQLFPVNGLSFVGRDGAELTVNVSREARGELHDGSLLRLYGDAEFDADLHDGSEVDRK